VLYHRLLAGRRVLVVLDGAAAVDQIRPLLPAAAGCAALVTVDGPGEHTVSQAAGDTESHADGHTESRTDSRTVSVGRMTPDEAQLLLARVLGPQRPAREPVAARALAVACDHLPGALRRSADLLVRRPAWSISALLPVVGGREKCGG
jgi:hypothetical protein